MWNPETFQDATARHEFIMVVPGQLSRAYLADAILLWQRDAGVAYHIGYRVAGHRDNIYSTLVNAGITLAEVDKVMDELITIANYNTSMNQWYQIELEQWQNWKDSFTPATIQLLSSTPGPVLLSKLPIDSPQSVEAPLLTLSPRRSSSPTSANLPRASVAVVTPLPRLSHVVPSTSSSIPTSSPRASVAVVTPFPREPPVASSSFPLLSAPIVTPFPREPPVASSSFPLLSAPIVSSNSSTNLLNTKVVPNPKVPPSVDDVERALLSAPTTLGSIEDGSWQGPPSPTNPRPGYAPGNIVAIRYGGGANTHHAFAYITGITSAGSLIAFYIPTKLINIDTGNNARVHRSQIIPDINLARQIGFGNHTTFRWSSKGKNIGYNDPQTSQHPNGAVNRYYQIPYNNISTSYI